VICRYALFVGIVRDGQEEAMRGYVMETLLPLWRRFEGAEHIRVLFGKEQDPEGDTIPLVLAITYRDEAAMQGPLKVRHAMRQKPFCQAFLTATLMAFCCIT